MKTKIVNFIDDKISDRFIEISGIVLLMLFYFVGLLSYITVPFTSFYKLFVSSSSLAVVLRAFMCGLICLYSLLSIIKYRLKVKWGWLVVFAFVLLFTLFALVISPMEYKFMYVEDLYKVVHVVDVSPGLKYSTTMFLSSIADFVFGFCLLFVLPFVINKPRKLLWLLLPIVVICLGECLYSAIKEKDIYIFLLNNPDDPFGGYGHEAGATFGNKEDWGAFLTISFISALVSNFFLDKNKKSTIFIRIGLIISCIIFAGFSLLSLCKSSMLALILCTCMLLIGLWAISLRKGKKQAIISSVLLGCLVLMIILMFVTNGFGIEIIGKVCTYFKNMILKNGSSAIDGRTQIWLTYVENVRGYNLFFGLGKAGARYYMMTLIKGGQSLIHNGFANFFAFYGLFGFIVFIILLFIIVRNIFNLYKINLFYPFLFIGIFFSCMVFILAESEVLLISTSTPVFVYNVLLAILPAGMLIKAKEEKQYA